VRGDLAWDGLVSVYEDLVESYSGILSFSAQNVYNADLNTDPPAVARRLREQWARQHPEETQDEKPAPVLAEVPREWWEQIDA
jgi:hypothetical protein